MLSDPIPITEDWLREIGFQWEQFDRQPEKVWVLWLGAALRETWTGAEDLAIELSRGTDDWFCWLRSDSAHRYHRFIHIRHLKHQRELIALIEALVGDPFDPSNVLYGALRPPEVAARIRAEQDRLDLKLLRGSHPWTEHEKDETRARPSIPHADAAIKGGLAK